MPQHLKTSWNFLWWTFGIVALMLAIGFWLGIVPVADASDHQSGVIEPADIPPATEAAPSPVQNEHWTDVPPVPAGPPDVERTGQCGIMNDGTEIMFLMRLWKTAQYAQYLPIANGVTGAVMATLIFTENDNEAQAVYVSLPGRPVERMTGRDLSQQWPHPCLMARATVGERT